MGRGVDVEGENARLRERVGELEKELEALRSGLGKALKELEEWKRGLRERGKRRSSRPEGAPRSRPKKRIGRKGGHPGAKRPAPERIDDEKVHAMPTECSCGGAVVATGETDTTVVVDLPVVRTRNVRHTAHVGRCSACQKRVAQRLPGAPAAGKIVAESSLGPNLQAMALGLRFEQHVPLAKIGAFLGQWYGVSVTSGGLSQMFDRLRVRSAASVEGLIDVARSSAVVGLDETGHRENGVPGWMWLMRTDRVSVFRAELSRGAWVADALLGPKFTGVLCSDFYSAYTRRDDWSHAYCGAHVIREAKKIAEVQPCAETARFRERIGDFYRAGVDAAASGDSGKCHGARIRLGRIVASSAWSAFPEVQRLQARLDTHWTGVTRFIERPDVPCTNNATERDIRDHARHRAMTGGTRSRTGSLTCAHWMSVTQTRRKNALPLRGFVTNLYASHLNGLPPPSVLAS